MAMARVVTFRGAKREEDAAELQALGDKLNGYPRPDDHGNTVQHWAPVLGSLTQAGGKPTVLAARVPAVDPHSGNAYDPEERLTGLERAAVVSAKAKEEDWDPVAQKVVVVKR